MNGVIIPVEVSDSGSTNITGITWTRYGNVIQVSVKGATVNSQTSITGLPNVRGGEYICNTTISGNSISGYVQHNNGAWIFAVVRAGEHYGSFCYLTV